MAPARRITIRCLLFARYAELAGANEVKLNLPDHSTVADAITELRSQVPAARGIPERPLAALNAVHALLDEEVHEGDELALLPPLAGGAA